MAQVLVIGGSRGIGLEAVKSALAAGHRVRVLARSADRIAEDHPALEKRKGSALEADDVAGGLEGIDVVIQALGVAAGPKMVLGPVRLFSGSTRVLLPAMKAAGVRRLISVTGFGAGGSRGALGCLQGAAFRIVLGRAYADKDLQERLIQQSGLDWTIVRPVILTDGPKTGRYRVLLDPESWRSGLISRADVADFLVKEIESKDHVHQSPVLLSRPL